MFQGECEAYVQSKSFLPSKNYHRNDATIFVDLIPLAWTEDDIREIFENVGNIKRIHKTDKNDKSTATNEECSEAIKNFHNQICKFKKPYPKLKVQIANTFLSQSRSVENKDNFNNSLAMMRSQTNTKVIYYSNQDSSHAANQNLSMYRNGPFNPEEQNITFERNISLPTMVPQACPPNLNVNLCFNCSKPAMFTAGCCSQAIYCSEPCCYSDWARHKKFCVNNRPELAQYSKQFGLNAYKMLDMAQNPLPIMAPVDENKVQQKPKKPLFNGYFVNDDDETPARKNYNSNSIGRKDESFDYPDPLYGVPADIVDHQNNQYGKSSNREYFSSSTENDFGRGRNKSSYNERNFESNSYNENDDHEGDSVGFPVYRASRGAGRVGGSRGAFTNTNSRNNRNDSSDSKWNNNYKSSFEGENSNNGFSGGYRSEWKDRSNEQNGRDFGGGQREWESGDKFDGSSFRGRGRGGGGRGRGRGRGRGSYNNASPSDAGAFGSRDNDNSSSSSQMFNPESSSNNGGNSFGGWGDGGAPTQFNANNDNKVNLATGNANNESNDFSSGGWGNASNTNNTMHNESGWGASGGDTKCDSTSWTSNNNKDKESFSTNDTTNKSVTNTATKTDEVSTSGGGWGGNDTGSAWGGSDKNNKVEEKSEGGWGAFSSDNNGKPSEVETIKETNGWANNGDANGADKLGQNGVDNFVNEEKSITSTNLNPFTNYSVTIEEKTEYQIIDEWKPPVDENAGGWGDNNAMPKEEENKPVATGNEIPNSDPLIDTTWTLENLNLESKEEPPKSIIDAVSPLSKALLEIHEFNTWTTGDLNLLYPDYDCRKKKNQALSPEEDSYVKFLESIPSTSNAINETSIAPGETVWNINNDNKICGNIETSFNNGNFSDCKPLSITSAIQDVTNQNNNNNDLINNFIEESQSLALTAISNHQSSGSGWD